MYKKKLAKFLSTTCAIALLTSSIAPSLTVSAAADKYKLQDTGNGYTLVTQTGGSTLGYSNTSGVKLVTDDGYAFKDLNKNGELDPYEDWRLDTDTRASDLAKKLVQTREGIEQIAGLMLYSSHQAINSPDYTEAQGNFLTNDNVRHVLVTTLASTDTAVQWNNNVQSLVEGAGFGIPVNSSSDPRHAASSDSDAEYEAGQGGTISKWPSSMGMTATFNPDLVKQFGAIASQEYRALGIATALSPQIDLATEPRWGRVNGTFGENSALSADLSRAYVDGFQTTYSEDGTSLGWGSDSVNAMVKHWPSGGPEEGGRDGHYGFGKFAVYPGNNFSEQLVPFTEGAFKLDDGTKSASAVMPYYTISYNQDTKYGENVGNSYSKYIITDLLRGEYNYDGVVCTDWMITADSTSDAVFQGKCWGVEELTVTGRHYKALLAGVDQFGGNNDKVPVLGAYDMMVITHGKTFTNNRFADSARRLLTNIFNTGLFENPYLDSETSQAEVGSSENMAAGYEAQLQSVVMVKNENNVISKATDKKKTVYLSGVNENVAKKFFNVTTDPKEADFAIIEMAAPSGGSGYNAQDRADGGNGYVPITLQYNPYTATTARETAIANSPEANFVNSSTGEFVYTDGVANRSYKGKTVTASNTSELTRLQELKETMGDKPVVVYMKQNNPMVWSEVEPLADGIVIGYGIMTQAALQVVAGETEPSGLLPMQQPANMETVEAQYEDVPQDMECYVDEAGNTYDFAFGLNWSGQIKDARTAKYAGIKPDEKPETVSVSKVKLDLKAATMYAGNSLTLKATVSPKNATNKKVTWSSSNKSVATVSSDGKVTAKSAGTVVITATAKDGSGKKATCKITVKKASVKLNKSSLTLKVGKTKTLVAKVAAAKDKVTSWTTSNKRVATVSSKGKVAAKKTGKATITVKTKLGAVAKCIVKVTKK